MDKIMLIVFILLLFVHGVVVPQERVLQPRRIGILDSNAIGISFYDDGAMSGFNLGTDIRGEWPRGSNYNYIANMTPMIGIEIINTKGDTIHPVIISRGPRNGQMNEHHPTFGYFWGFNPLPGYVDTSQSSVAMSNKPASWPALWADHPEWGFGVWNGFRGPNTFSTTLETYFKLTDVWDDEFNDYFKPDTSDSTMTGYGISVGVRYFQSNDPLYKNVIIRMFDITNNSDYTYRKVIWGNMTGDMLGGDGDSGDDLAYYDEQNDFVYAWDYDGIGNSGQRVGYIAEAFLQAPESGKIASHYVFNISASPDMSNDELLWNKLLPGNIDTVNPPVPQDGDYMYGSNYFSLAPSETKRVVAALALANSYSEVTQEILDARALWNSQFDTTAVLNSVRLLNLNYHRTISGDETIEWSSTRNGGSIDLWYSKDYGETWERVAVSQPNTGSYLLHTNELEDSPVGIFKIFIKDSLGNIYGFNQSHAVTIDNEVNGVPYVKILSPIFSSDTVITDCDIDAQLLICDAESDSLNVSLYYSVDDGADYKLFDTYSTLTDTLPQTHAISLRVLPNSTRAKLKIIVSDSSLSYFDTTKTFSKINPRDTLSADMIHLMSGYCNIPYRINVVDSSLLTWDSYLITFDDTTQLGQKYLTVSMASDRDDIITHERIVPFSESSIFHGLSFYCEDHETQIDSSKSGWNVGAAKPLSFLFDRFVCATSGPGIAYNGYKLPSDYQIEFFDHIVDTSLVDTLYPPTPSNIVPAKEVNFLVKNLSTNQYIDFVYWKTGSVTTIFNMYFKESVGNQKKRTWRLNLYDQTAGASLPTSDTLIIKTIKGLSFLDSILIGNISGIQNNRIFPVHFYLAQNYPNPFNPSTKIEYSIPKTNQVTIKIYDILGREIATMVNERKQAGKYKVTWNAEGVPSGVYFYRIVAGDFVETKKMVVVK